MNALQYLVLGMAIIAVIRTPFMLAEETRRKQKKRIFDVIASDLMFLYLAVDVIWPSAIASAPQPVRLLIVVFCLVWLANFFGAFGRLFNRQKAAPIERR